MRLNVVAVPGVLRRLRLSNAFGVHESMLITRVDYNIRTLSLAVLYAIGIECKI